MIFNFCAALEPSGAGNASPNEERWLSRLIKPDAVDQIHKTRVAAQGIKVGMDFYQLQDV
jgi:hypothetical protein